MLLEMNKRDIDALSPPLLTAFAEIDALGQKKEDKIQKIALFEKMTNIVEQLSENRESG
jgi:uncharacterized protein (DUF4213/DUF364 family)